MGFFVISHCSIDVTVLFASDAMLAKLLSAKHVDE